MTTKGGSVVLLSRCKRTSASTLVGVKKSTHFTVSRLNAVILRKDVPGLRFFANEDEGAGNVFRLGGGVVAGWVIGGVGGSERLGFK